MGPRPNDSWRFSIWSNGNDVQSSRFWPRAWTRRRGLGDLMASTTNGASRSRITSRNGGTEGSWTTGDQATIAAFSLRFLLMPCSRLSRNTPSAAPVVIRKQLERVPGHSPAWPLSRSCGRGTGVYLAPQRGQPFGAARWRVEVAARLGLESALRSRGPSRWAVEERLLIALIRRVDLGGFPPRPPADPCSRH